MTQSLDCKNGIPLPIVQLNRTLNVVGVLAALALQQPLITTALFAIMAPAALFGSRGSLVFQIGTRAFAKANAGAETEDRRLMRFNNALAAIMFGIAQICFAAHLTLLGWIFCCMVLVAASVALAGFCVGCFLFFRFKMARYKLFGT
jgi:hypothetical protein